MIKNVYLDNNMWDFLYQRRIDLSTLLSKRELKLCITREGFYEIKQIPNNDDKQELISYISEYLESDIIEEKPVFGFYNPYLPKSEQRYGGFDTGFFTTDDETSERKRLNSKYKKNKKRKNSNTLYNNEADIELATRGLKNIVVSFDKKMGPLKDAKQNGGKIIFLDHDAVDIMTNEEFIEYLSIKIETILN